jgi:transcriptional regulator GlxA family with amidase domain
MSSATMSPVQTASHEKAYLGDSVKRIGIYLSSGCASSDVAAIGEVLQAANERPLSGHFEGSYRLILVSARGGAVVTSSGIAMPTRAFDVNTARELDVLFISQRKDAGNISHWTHIGRPAVAELARSKPVGGGLWHVPFDIFPAIRSYANGTGGAGTTTVFARDAALAFVASDRGGDVFEQVSSGLDSPYPNSLQPWEDQPRFYLLKVRESARWLRDYAHDAVTVAQAIERSGLSSRTFLRHFRAEFGVAPLEYLTSVRMELVCQLLVETSLPVDKVARRCGLSNGSRLGRLFAQRYRTTPSDYRDKHFRAVKVEGTSTVSDRGATSPLKRTT